MWMAYGGLMSNLIGTNSDQVPVNGMLGTLAFQDAESVNVVALAAQTLALPKTISTTTGIQTINKPAGSVIFVAGATSLVVTNSLVTVNSVIIATVATVDSTLKSVAAVAAAGSFTLTGNAAATAATRVNFLVVN